METQVSVTFFSLDEAAVAIAAVDAFRSKKAQPPAEAMTASSALADHIYAALQTSTFTKPSQVVTSVLLDSPPSQHVPLSKFIDAFVAEGLAKDDQEAWNRLRAAFATISWMMGQKLPAEAWVGVKKPIDVFAARSVDQHGKRLYRLTEAGRAAAKRFFKK